MTKVRLDAGGCTADGLHAIRRLMAASLPYAPHIAVDFSAAEVERFEGAVQVRQGKEWKPLGLSIRTASYCSLQVQFLADVEQLVTQLCATGEYVRLRMFPLPLSREALAEWDVDGLWKEEVGENEVGTAALVLKLVHDGTAIAIAAHQDLATVIAPILDEIQSRSGQPPKG